MIEFRTEQLADASVVRLTGRFEGRDRAEQLAALIGANHQPGERLDVDLSGVDDADFDPIAWFVLRLEACPGWRGLRLVDHRVTTRRVLRAIARRLPVVPDPAGTPSAPAPGSPVRQLPV